MGNRRDSVESIRFSLSTGNRSEFGIPTPRGTREVSDKERMIRKGVSSMDTQHEISSSSAFPAGGSTLGSRTRLQT